MQEIVTLGWDTDFFGYKIASVRVSELRPENLTGILNELKSQEVRLAYCFADPSDSVSNESLKDNQCFLADEKVTYMIDIPVGMEYDVSDNIIQFKSDKVTDQLRELALQSGLYSRFKVDKGFRNNEFERLYTEWIEKSVEKKLANEILTFSDNNEIYGFITLVIKPSNGSIGLIAVDESQRGKAIGKKLINAALDYFKNHNISRVEVVTQKNNNSACRFYESCGFKIKSIQNIYHIWIK
jgi:dTDP-4-amino-4,6-dideoxy-D-galactose acyltransferase